MGDKDTMAGAEGKRQTGISTGVLTAGPDAHPEKVWLHEEKHTTARLKLSVRPWSSFVAKLSADS